MDGSGDFVVVWTSEPPFENGFDVHGQRFDSAGAALGAELEINSHTEGNQVGIAIAADADGDFVVVWTSSASTSAPNRTSKASDSPPRARSWETSSR